MPLIHDRAICLRKIDYSETSQILLLFTRTHGLVRVIAKGAHRRTKAGASKFDGGLDLLDVGRAVIVYSNEKDLSTLTEWALIEGHLSLRKTLRGMFLAQYSAEMIWSLMEEHDPHPDVFDLLERATLQFEQETREEVFLFFQLRLLRILGSLPTLERCASCDRAIADRVYFSPATGGVICDNCEAVTPDRQSIDAGLIQLAARLAKNPTKLPKLGRSHVDPLNKLLADHVEQLIGKKLRMRDYVLA